MEFIPEVNDEVLVAFENDDIHRPYILGSLWNKQDKPPEATDKIVANGKVNKRIIRSRTGHEIVLDDSENAEKIIIKDKTGNNKVEIDSQKKALSVQTDQTIVFKTKGGLQILMDDQGKKIEIIDGGNTIKINGTSNLISIESAMQLEIKAKTIKIEGTTMDLKASGPMNVEGGLTTVKASGVLTVQGSLVKIN
jgi:uncharacterized protein involved in type VI secretion and phage assembly